VTLRVLVADDQAPFRRAVRTVLSSTHDFELVGEATSGEEAVELACELAPDLVLMDIEMEGLGGIAAVASIVEFDPHILTVLVSTYRPDDLPVGVDTCGAQAYLHKAELRIGALRRLVERGRS
jgi:two-component system invasion response regulator UvrY